MEKTYCYPEKIEKEEIELLRCPEGFDSVYITFRENEKR